MTGKSIDPGLKAYARAFRKLSRKNLKNGNAVVILVYHDDCEGCQAQLRYFRDRLKIKLDGTDSKKKLDRIINRIYLLNIESKEFDNLQSRLSYRIEGTPAWININTRQFLGYGYQFGKGLLVITRKK